MNAALRAFEEPSARKKVNGSKNNSVSAVDERAAERRNSLAQRVSAEKTRPRAKPRRGGINRTHISPRTESPIFESGSRIPVQSFVSCDAQPDCGCNAEHRRRVRGSPF